MIERVCVLEYSTDRLSGEYHCRFSLSNVEWYHCVSITQRLLKVSYFFCCLITLNTSNLNFDIVYQNCLIAYKTNGANNVCV